MKRWQKKRQLLPQIATARAKDFHSKEVDFSIPSGMQIFKQNTKTALKGPVRRLSLKTERKYPQQFFSIFKRDSGEFKRIAAAGSPGETKSRVATGYSLALCLVLISMIKRFHISNSAIRLS